ncbi:Germin-like protein sub 1 member 8 [Ancistrocladus abbreviatus]
MENKGAKVVAYLMVVALLAMTGCLKLAYATDPTQLQDFCVGTNDPNATVFVNGLFCMDPKLATPGDFFFSSLDKPGNTNKKVGSNVTLVSATNLHGLNTLGISMARIDFAPYGENPPHTHPRATEILTVIKGQLLVGFVTSNLQNGGNRLFSKLLNEGDVFVFPQGLIHFQMNVGKTNAIAIAALSSQNPGVVTIANAVFGSNPPISADVLTKAFQLDKATIKYLLSKF